MRMRIASGEPEWNTCPRSPSRPASMTSVISTSREPQRPFRGAEHVGRRLGGFDRMIREHGGRRFVGRDHHRRFERLGVGRGELRLLATSTSVT